MIAVPYFNDLLHEQ